MFHPEVVARRVAHFERAYASELPGGRLPYRSHDECWAYRNRLKSAVDDKGRLTRQLTDDESAFIQTERLLTKLDFRYWGERYAIIAKETQEASPLFPLWASQDLFLRRVAALEVDRVLRGHPDGILVNVLKARQLGLSTLTETILAHRITTQTALRALVAADVREQSEYMFSMCELVLDHLPWWLHPPDLVKAHQTGSFWASTTGTTIRVAWGKSARGGMQDQAKVKGNIGRGKTYGALHLSELSTWEKPEQIEDALLPGVPRRPRTFMVRESTAKGRYDYWHREWIKASKSLGRFTNIFIPWYIEPDKYWAPPPDGWTPAPETVAHAESVERDSPKWTLGQTVRLSKAQLYWYESTKAAFVESDELYKFYEEYPATPEESFQYAGRSIFSASVLERVRTYERAPAAVCFVEPASDIAQLKAWEMEEARRVKDAAPR